MAKMLKDSWRQGSSASITINHVRVPKGARLISCRKFVVGGDAGQELIEDGFSDPAVAKVGIAWSQIEFAKQAQQVVHPCDQIRV